MKATLHVIVYGLSISVMGCGGSPIGSAPTGTSSAEADGLPPPLRASSKSYAQTQSTQIDRYAYALGYSDSVTWDATAYPYSQGWAVFWKDTGSTSCSMTTAGGCYLIDCAAATSSGSQLDGGKVTVGSLSMTPDASNDYVAENDTASLWSAAGDPVAFNVQGQGEVPAMSGSVPAPGRITITTPALTAQSFTDDIGHTNLAFDRSQDLPVSWTSTGATDYFDIGLYNPNNPAKSLVCYFDPSQQQGAIPAALLKQLDAGDAALWTEVSNWREQSGTPGWDIWLGAESTPHTADGLGYGAYITLN